MAISNHERVGKALDLVKDGLTPFIERELKAQDAQRWLDIAPVGEQTQERLFKDGAKPQWDAASLLAVLWNQWNVIFKKTLGQAERTLVSELRDVRNRWAHQNPFSSDDAYRALDSSGRLLAAVSAAPQADELEKMKMELLRVRFDEQMRSEKRKSAGGDREPGCRRPQAMARGGDAAQGRGDGALPAGRVRGRPLAGSHWRGL
ncbi:MAG: Swt1 family HEPN domain-containing protein [Vicinamibacterales bacterium]